MLKLAEYTQRSSILKEKVISTLSELNAGFSIDDNNSRAIRLVFVGQYSAGKSSIIKMLTGRKDITIGAGITTQRVHKYIWNSLEVIDTPGIHTELRQDHDDISYEAIASADVLVFVVTNELFDSHISEHFRKLAVDKDKASEMILVVNKMERTENGNSESQRAIIQADLRKVLEPYTPEQFYLSFLDAESYLDAVKELEVDPELAEELIERSGHAEFIKTLNCFVEAKGIPSKLTTDLYIIDKQLEESIKKLQPQSTDEDIDALEESLLQQRHVLIEARGQLQQTVKDIYATHSSKIREIGLNAANLIEKGCDQEEVERSLESAIREADDLIEKCQIEAIEVINARLTEIGQRLNDIETSELSVHLKARLIGKIHKLPESIQRMLANAGPGFEKAGKTVMSSAYKQGSSGGLKLTSFSDSTIHKMVLNVGKKIGYKFKPWQAVKVTKGIAIGGQVLSTLGVCLSVFMQIKSDLDEEQHRKDLRNNRQNIRSQFNDAANELEEYGRRFIKENVNSQFSDPIAKFDAGIQEIRDSRKNRSTLCRKLEELQQECQSLIRDIHTADTYN